MQEFTRTQELFVQSATLWSEAAQRVLQQLVELGGAGASESMRLSAELQRGALEGLRQAQGAALRWQGLWKEAVDPARWWSKALGEVTSDAQQAFRLAEEQARSLTRAAERWQATTEQASKAIVDTLVGTATKVAELCSAR